jgi:hypothetical protein
LKDYRKNHSKIRIPAKKNNNLLAPLATLQNPPEVATEVEQPQPIKDNGSRFTVKAAQWVMEKFKDQDTPTRKIIELGKDLTWQEAKKMVKINKNSWIV